MTEEFEINITLVSRKDFGDEFPRPVPFEEIINDFSRSDDYVTLSRKVNGVDLGSIKDRFKDMDISFQFLDQDLAMDGWSIQEVWKMTGRPSVNFIDKTITIEYRFDKYYISCEVGNNYEKSLG